MRNCSHTLPSKGKGPLNKDRAKQGGNPPTEHPEPGTAVTLAPELQGAGTTPISVLKCPSLFHLTCLEPLSSSQLQVWFTRPRGPRHPRRLAAVWGTLIFLGLLCLICLLPAGCTESTYRPQRTRLPLSNKSRQRYKSLYPSLRVRAVKQKSRFLLRMSLVKT